MNYRENFFIFSVYLASADDEVNKLNHNFVKAQLERKQLPFKEILGMYKGQEEMAFVILGLKNEVIAQNYCAMFKQESYLMVHNDRTADLKLLTNEGVKVERLGQYVPVPDSVNVKDLKNWSKDISSGGYFYIVNK